MKIDRLIGILTVLLQQQTVTAPYLAEKFDVSRRTINRDIDSLAQAGISPKIKQYLLGHATVDITQNVYTDAQSDYINSVSDRIRGIFDTK